MTEFESTLIDSTKELMSDLMHNLSSIESVEIVKDFVGKGEVVILCPDGSIKKLSIIPEDGLSTIKSHILQQLDYELSASLTKLKYLTDAHSSYSVDESALEASEEPTEAFEEVSIPDDSEVYGEAVVPDKIARNRQGIKADVDMKEVIKLRAAGWSLKKIADKFGCCEQTILNKLNKAEKSNKKPRKEQAS